jgi:hypothetical protein
MSNVALYSPRHSFEILGFRCLNATKEAVSTVFSETAVAVSAVAMIPRKYTREHFSRIVTENRILIGVFISKKNDFANFRR